jgi:ComF family protein
MPGLSDRLRFLLRSFGDFLFPPVCFGCEQEVEHGVICDSCRLLLWTSELEVCPECGRPCARAETGCGRCETEFCLSRVRALGPYHPPYNNLVHALKYREKTRLALVLGSALAALVGQDPDLKQADALCPVPLHPARRRERGYNQSALLALVVSGITGIPVEETLVRVRNTSTQTGKGSDAARAQNLAGAFALKKGAEVSGRRIILVDDVMTSGATLHEAGLALKRAGATEILGLVVAAAGRPRPAPRAPGSRAGTKKREGTRASAARSGAGRSASG